MFRLVIVTKSTRIPVLHETCHFSEYLVQLGATTKLEPYEVLVLEHRCDIRASWTWRVRTI